MSDNLVTIDDIINANRSPPLSPARVNYRATESPPPGLDLEDKTITQLNDSPKVRQESLQPKPSLGRLQPSLSDSFLIGLLAPNYPEIASKASRELIFLPLESAPEEQKPAQAFRTQQMVSDYAKQASNATGGTEVIAVAAFEASQKLNAAIGSNLFRANRMSLYQSSYEDHRRPSHDTAKNELYRKSSSPKDHALDSRSPPYSSERALNVRPPPRVSLPSIHTTSPVTDPIKHHHQRGNSIISSPILAKYTINAANGNPEQQLPRMQISPTLPLSSMSNSSRQTLPSLETALSAISAPPDTTSIAQSPSLVRNSPAQMSYFGPSPSTYTNPSPASTISPPRLPTAPVYWRTTSRDTMNSTPSDHASASASNGVSTPASSVPALSPSQSALTPAAIEHDARYGDDPMILNGLTPRQGDDSQYPGVYGSGSFRCSFPGCNAQPFQTQYLLNSHANVHSNTRPHFCPVENCPRGPGGQGFKRKNEMIRHGLVHQSPGYVCPFCPDQQHKYPRPDNLQRHVRVHHVDRDRDDPMLREVLAQRPEGGNRGRRRRLGS